MKRSAITLYGMAFLGIVSLCKTFPADAGSLGSADTNGQVVTAPLNKTQHVGNINGVKISIPPKYWASVVLQNKENPDSCSDSLSQVEYKCPIWAISLFLRYPSFAPIYTQQDLNEWHSNFMRPFEKQDPGQHWLAMGYRGDMYLNTQGDLRAMYRSHFEEATKHFGQLSCDSKYLLEHCITEKQDVPAKVNEFYFDVKNGQTLIECERYAPPNGRLISCQHYFVVPKIRAVAEIGVSSDMEVAMWESFNQALQDVAASLVAK